MRRAAVGNDIVDLADVDSRGAEKNKRFIQRVFSPIEREYLLTQPREEMNQSIWVMWAAKEASFKAVKRLRPETTFRMQEFVVDVNALRVEYRDLTIPFVLEQGADYTFVVCVAGDGNLPDRLAHVHSWHDTCHLPAKDPAKHLSRQVRVLALRHLAADLSVATERLQIVRAPNDSGLGEPPELQLDGEALPCVISLTHHGRFVATSYLPAEWAE